MKLLKFSFFLVLVFFTSCGAEKKDKKTFQCNELLDKSIFTCYSKGSESTKCYDDNTSRSVLFELNPDYEISSISVVKNGKYSFEYSKKIGNYKKYILVKKSEALPSLRVSIYVDIAGDYRITMGGFSLDVEDNFFRDCTSKIKE